MTWFIHLYEITQFVCEMTYSYLGHDISIYMCDMTSFIHGIKRVSDRPHAVSACSLSQCTWRHMCNSILLVWIKKSRENVTFHANVTTRCAPPQKSIHLGLLCLLQLWKRLSNHLAATELSFQEWQQVTAPEWEKAVPRSNLKLHHDWLRWYEIQ